MLTRQQTQDALLPAVTLADDAARLCGQALCEIDTGTAILRSDGLNTEPLDVAAGLVRDARRKLQQAHTLIVGVALAK